MKLFDFVKNNKESKDEKIKNAFARMRQDILYLQQELIILKQELIQINKLLNQILASKTPKTYSKTPYLHSNTSSTNIQQTKSIPTHISKNYGLNNQFFHSSIRNEGVPTDSQQISNRQIIPIKRTFSTSNNLPSAAKNFEIIENQNRTIPQLSNISDISNIVTSMKQDLQDKFKKLTKQEFMVFSILYTLEQELPTVTYRDIALRANLAESSIRDYISRLEHKGIPIVKERINNKIVILKIPRELRDIATLDSLSKLVRL